MVLRARPILRGANVCRCRAFCDRRGSRFPALQDALAKTGRCRVPYFPNPVRKPDSVRRAATRGNGGNRVFLNCHAGPRGWARTTVRGNFGSQTVSSQTEGVVI